MIIDYDFQDTDLAVAPNTNGIYDMVVENGKFKSVRNFETALLMSVFCERRADESEAPSPEYRRGWWGNLVLSNNGFELGSKIWLLHQARRDQATLNKLIDYFNQALSWLVDEGHAKNYTVTGVFSGKSGYTLQVNILTLNNKIDSRYVELWNNTGPVTFTN